MAHDHTLRLQVLRDAESDGENRFRFILTDGDGKQTFFKDYVTPFGDLMWSMVDGAYGELDGEEYRTRAECMEIMKQVRRDLHAVPQA